MEFAKPVKVAFGRLEHVAFIKRHLDVYKKPDITEYPIAAYEFDFLDFIYSLGLINIQHSLKNASILILDEATSSIDSHAEQEIQKSINSILDIHNTTVIAIAHRLSTIKHRDRFIVMEDGNIVEDGSFQVSCERWW